MLLPIALDVAAKKCLVVGGGKVAARKVNALLECGARVHVVAPNVCEELQQLLGQAKYSSRDYQIDDCNDCDLVFACTSDQAVNAQIASDAQIRKIWCNVADASAASTFHLSAAIRRGEICIGISTNGGSPALSKHLKAEVEDCIGNEYAELLNLMSARRALLKSKIETQSQRAAIWREVLESEVLVMLRAGQTERAEELMDSIIRS